MCWNPSLPLSTEKKGERRKKRQMEMKSCDTAYAYQHHAIAIIKSKGGQKYYSVTFFLLFIINNGQDFLYYSLYTHNYTRSVLLYIMEYSFGSCALIF